MISPLTQNLLERASVCIKARDFASADPLVAQVLRQDSKNLQGLCYQAIIAAETGRKELALTVIKQAMKLGPNNPGVLNNAAAVFFKCGQPARASQLWEKVIEMRPQAVEARWNLARYLLREEGDYDAAEKHIRTVLEQAPDHPTANISLGNLLKNSGRTEEGMVFYREGTRRHPGNMNGWSSYLFTMHFDPASSPERIYREHAEWGRKLEESIPQVLRHDNEAAPGRRLRVGYVSPFFRRHVLGHNLMPLLRKHDHARFEIFCYSDVHQEDDFTEQLRRFTDRWCVTEKMTDAELAKQVAEDKIDILVDLNMNMKGTRLGVFARKPAPVQVAFLAYPGTTGLKRMDYRLTDPVLDPPGTDGLYTEQSVRLETFWCFEPLAGCPVVGPLPADANGYVTFGCLNNFNKVNAGVLESWREVLAAVPRSRIMLMPPKGKTIAWLVEKLNVDPARLECRPKQKPLEYLALYNQIDLALDPFPYTGHTTTLDGLWMGVPLVTRTGSTTVSRGSSSILTNLGLPELVTTTKDDYVKLAVQLANDLPRLRELRSSLRARMEKSVLMDAERCARKLEAAYRMMWGKWCEAQSATT